MELSSLNTLYIDRLKDIYSAERQLLKALPTLSKAAQNAELQKAIDNHVVETELQVRRLDEIFSDLRVDPKGKKCRGMEGLIDEVMELMKEDATDEVRDAGLIACAQAVEHYEMAGYGTARTYAQLLGFSGHQDLLQKSLDEEANADATLNDIALRTVNVDALQGSASTGRSGRANS